MSSALYPLRFLIPSHLRTPLSSFFVPFVTFVVQIHFLTTKSTKNTKKNHYKTIRLTRARA